MFLYVRPARSRALSRGVARVEQGAAPAGVPHKHALGRPRGPALAALRLLRLQWLDGTGRAAGNRRDRGWNATPPESRKRGPEDRKAASGAPGGASPRSQEEMVRVSRIGRPRRPLWELRQLPRFPALRFPFCGQA